MITIQIDENELLEQLVERVKFWTDDTDTIELYEKMYENYIDNGYFDGQQIDIMQIVDNDYVNWCSVIEKGDEDYEKVDELYKDGQYDISCETCYSFVESEKDGIYLVRQ